MTWLMNKLTPQAQTLLGEHRMTIDYDKLKNVPRLLIEAKLKPLQGQTLSADGIRGPRAGALHLARPNRDAAG